ncbi:MAG TPA: DUF1800 domain-containing protein, partial [Ktedonobacterales bacterium]|nr:DUF1800 domain-containing protein [Ktedonobacterales bacterium]
MNKRGMTQPGPDWDAGQPTDSQWYTPPFGAAGTPPPPVPTRRRSGVRLSRRGLLIGAGAVGVGAAAITGGILYINAGHKSTIATGNQIQHLLRRAGFGARADEIQQYSQLGVSGAIERLLNYTQVSDDIDSRLSSLNLNLSTIPDSQRWWLLRMLYSQRPLQEKMTLFWHGLLTSSYTKVGGKAGYGFMVKQNTFLRDHALDKYDTILLGITQDPAMMNWLDLRLDRKNSPNENYARELMELFTMGVSSGYTQTDVHDSARALTGFTLSRDGTVTYNPAQHDNGQKTLLGHTGDLSYHDVISIVAGHPATGPFLSKRLFQFFVHENPSTAELQPMVDAYYHSGHSIMEVMRAMFNSPAFFAPAAYRSRIKSPAEFVVGAIRQLDLETQGQGLSTAMTQMGQTIFDPPNVAGWPGDQASDNWMSTSTWLARVNFINAIFNTQTGGNIVQDAITKYHLKTPDDLVNHYTGVLIDGQLSTARRQSLSQYLS